MQLKGEEIDTCKIFTCDLTVQFNKISYLNTVVASCYSAVLNFHIWRWMRKFALAVWASTLLSLILSTHFQLEPTRVFLIEECAHVEHGDGLRVDVGGVGHDGGSGHAGVRDDSPTWYFLTEKFNTHTCLFKVCTCRFLISINMAAWGSGNQAGQDSFSFDLFKSHFLTSSEWI